MSIVIHPKIEVGTGTGTLRVADEDLAALTAGGFLRAYLDGDRFVLSGGQWGDHSLDARETITSADRLIAHWRGYVENNRRGAAG